MEKGDIVKILGLFTQSVSEISQSIKSLEIKFQDENFTLYSDSISQEADFGNLYNGVFGKLFGNIKGSSKKLATIQDGGNYIRIGVDSEHTISVNTDSYCRIDIYFIETKDLIAFSNDFSLIDSLLNEYSNLDQISLAHSLSIYGNRPPKKGTFFTEIKRFGTKLDDTSLKSIFLLSRSFLVTYAMATLLLAIVSILLRATPAKSIKVLDLFFSSSMIKLLKSSSISTNSAIAFNVFELVIG